jgi:hypothetical protein
METINERYQIILQTLKTFKEALLDIHFLTKTLSISIFLFILC